MSTRLGAFDSFSEHALAIVRTPYAFVIALALVGAWVAFGFQVGFTNTFYQLLINTGTTIVTFLLGFLILYNGHKQATADHLEQLEEHAEILREIRALHAPDDGRWRRVRLGWTSIIGAARQRRFAAKASTCSTLPRTWSARRMRGMNRRAPRPSRRVSRSASFSSSPESAASGSARSRGGTVSEDHP